MESGESIYEGLIREIKEETNLDISKIVNYVNSFDYLSGSGKKARQYNFAVRVKDTKNVELTEHDEYKWMSIEEARNDSKITDEVKNTLEIYYFTNSRKRIKWKSFCATLGSR
jgi:8-oxo-dGTP diphosphatase